MIVQRALPLAILAASLSIVPLPMYLSHALAQDLPQPVFPPEPTQHEKDMDQLERDEDRLRRDRERHETPPKEFMKSEIEGVEADLARARADLAEAERRARENAEARARMREETRKALLAGLRRWRESWGPVGVSPWAHGRALEEVRLKLLELIAIHDAQEQADEASLQKPRETVAILELVLSNRQKTRDDPKARAYYEHYEAMMRELNRAVDDKKERELRERRARLTGQAGTQTSAAPLDIPGSPFTNCGYPGELGCGYPTSLPLGSVSVPLAADGQAFCTFGPAEPYSVLFTPADEAGNPLAEASEISLAPPAPRIMAMSPVGTGIPLSPNPAGQPIVEEIEQLLQTGDQPTAADPPTGGGTAPDPAATYADLIAMLDRPPPRGLPPVNIGDGAPIVPASTPKPNEQTGGDGNDPLNAAPGPDLMTGGTGLDSFTFTVNADFPDADRSKTLDSGDRITDYESDEMITITGVLLKPENVTVVYDGEKDETRLEIDFHGPYTGAPRDGVSDRTIILNGDKRGDMTVTPNCCSTETTEIKIKLPRQGAPSQSTGTAGPGEQPASPQKQAQPGQKSATGGKSEKSAADDKPEVPISDGSLTVVVTLHIKATEGVLKGETAGPDLDGEMVKLVAIEKHALPRKGEKRTQAAQNAGSDHSPVTCTTGPGGECMARVAAQQLEAYGFPARGGLHYQAKLSLGKNTGGVFERTGIGKTVMPDVPKGAFVLKTDFKIGEKKYTRFDVRGPQDIISDVVAKLRQALGNFKIDPCIEKAPGPACGMEPISLTPPESDLPLAALQLRKEASPGRPLR